MADGLNQARALRVAEIINDFRNIQSYLANIRVNPSAQEQNEEGYVLLRRCDAEAQALLQQPFDTYSGTRSDDEEEEKTHLRRIITDAAVRRFKAQKIYLCARAALRWANSRAAILQGQQPQQQHQAALQQARNQLRSELNGLTDQGVEQSLRSADVAAGKWLAEDPNLQTLQRLSSNGNGNGNGNGHKNGNGNGGAAGSSNSGRNGNGRSGHSRVNNGRR